MVLPDINSINQHLKSKQALLMVVLVSFQMLLLKKLNKNLIDSENLFLDPAVMKLTIPTTVNYQVTSYLVRNQSTENMLRNVWKLNLNQTKICSNKEIIPLVLTHLLRVIMMFHIFKHQLIANIFQN